MERQDNGTAGRSCRESKQKRKLTAECASYVLPRAFLYLFAFKFLKGTISPCCVSLHSNPIILNTLHLFLHLPPKL